MLAWLRFTATLVALTVKSLPRPTKVTLSAVACKLVQLRATVRGSASGVALRMAMPKLRSESARPSLSGLAPLRPAKADSPLPPTVSLSTARVSLEAKVMVCVLFSTAKSPWTCTKPYTLMLIWPETLSSSPLTPSLVSVRLVEALVVTVSAVLPAA